MRYRPGEHPGMLTYTSVAPTTTDAICWEFVAHAPDTTSWEISLQGMGITDRAVLRALCQHMVRQIDTLEAKS